MSLFTDGAERIPDPFLRRAYRLAEIASGRTSPNPVVGCVIVKDGVVVGEGYHERAGAPHAETVALDHAGDAARGATMYVTLEPCNHVGRTPPCTPRIIEAGVESVVIGMRDPNPDVVGGGAEALERAGVRVSFVHDETPFRALNEGWLTRMHTGRPFITAKVALTIDGRPALAMGRRSHITGQGGREITMRLRSRSTAVAVGAATLAIDDPALTVRDAYGRLASHQPVRVVLSRTSVPSPEARIFTDEAAPVMLVVSDRVRDSQLERLTAAGVQVLRYPYASGIEGALRALAGAGIDDVLVECGPSLLSALYPSGCLDQLVVVTAGGMAGTTAPPVFLGTGDIEGFDLRPRMAAVEAGVAGGDAATVWRPIEPVIRHLWEGRRRCSQASSSAKAS